MYLALLNSSSYLRLVREAVAEARRAEGRLVRSRVERLSCEREDQSWLGERRTETSWLLGSVLDILYILELMVS